MASSRLGQGHIYIFLNGNLHFFIAYSCSWAWKIFKTIQ